MTKMSVALAFLLAFCTLIYNVHGGGKGFKAKGVDLKKKLVHKIFHHNHHHHYHHHYTHHPKHHHHHHHRHPHHYHHHDGKIKHLNHHRHHHHHYHNPFKHHLHRHHHPHKKTFHRHPRKHSLHRHHHLHKQHQPLHRYHRLHKQHIQKHQKDVEHYHSYKRAGISHAPVPNKLQLHVRTTASQATKRQSLPDLLANLGQHLVKLGSSLSPKTSQMAVYGNTDNKGDLRNEVPEPKSSTNQSRTVQESPLALSAVSLKKNMSVNEAEGPLHHALDAVNGDEMESAFSGNGATEARDVAASNMTDGATAKGGDRRNETFPEAEIYGRPLDDREYDASGRQRESANKTLEEIAGQPFETENTRQLDQTRNGQSNSGKENKLAVHENDQSKNVEPKTNVDDVDTTTALEHEKTKENTTQNDPPKLKTQSSSEESKSSDMNSTLEDEGRDIEKDTSKSGAGESEKSVTGESDAQDIIDDERKKSEVSGSGEESFDDGNTEEQTANNNEGSHESKTAKQAPSKPSLDEEVNVAEESIDQNTIGSAEGQQVRERKGKPFINQTEDSLDEPTRPVSEGNIDRQAVVNVAENQIMVNRSDDLFQPDSTEGADLKMEGSNFGNKKLINPRDSNDPEKTVSGDSRIKGGSIQDAKLRGDLDTLAIQHGFSGPENSVPAANPEKVLRTKNGGPSTQLDAIIGNSNQSNEQDHPALNDIESSGASNVGQESPQENEGTQDQDSHSDIVGFAEGPKTSSVLDEPAEPLSPSDADPQVVNVESPQEGNLQEDTSQDTEDTSHPEDVADEIPVYTLSSPVGDETFRGDESILSTPTSSVSTSSVNFIDTGGDMSTGNSESPSSSEGYGTFTAPVSQSQEDFDSLSQGAVVQRDMLDDPVQESLETTVDSKSS